MSSVYVQLVRIALNALGSFLFGDAVANGDQWQGLIGAVTALIAYVWWAVSEYKKSKT